MANKILLTSFTTWLPHHKSNSSDDLLNEITQRTGGFTDQICMPTDMRSLPAPTTFPSLTFLRKLPVDVELASCCVIAKIKEIQPDGIICCGMSERRPKLTVESNAICGDNMLKTPVDLNQLVAGSAEIEISLDAGKFVCEGLYYSVLKYVRDRQMNTRCIFVHVPILTETNLAEMVADFRLIIRRIGFL